MGKPGTLACNGADKFNSNEVKQLCIKQSVRLEFSTTYATEEKGKIEPIWGTTFLMAKCLIEQSELDETQGLYEISMSSEMKSFLLPFGIQKNNIRSKVWTKTKN